MRYPREDRNFSPQYVQSSRDIDYPGGSTSHHVAVSRQSPISRSPPRYNRQGSQSPERGDFRPQRLDRGSRVNQDYVSQYQPRGRHSPPARHSRHDLHENYTDLNHRTEVSPELEPQPMVTQKFGSLDYGPGRSQSAKQKQQSVATSGTHHMELYHRHLQDPCEEDIDPRVNRHISPEYDGSRHNSVILAEHIDVPGDTASHKGRLQNSLGPPPCNHQRRQSSERSDFRPPRLDRGGLVSQEYVSQHQSRRSHSPVRHCHHDSHANYTELNHHTELSSELKHEPMVTQKFDSLDHGLGRSQSAKQKQQSVATSGSHHLELYRHHLQDQCDEERNQREYSNISPKYDRSRHNNVIFAEHIDIPGDTVSHKRRLQNSLGSPPCNHQGRQSSERSDFRPPRFNHQGRQSSERSDFRPPRFNHQGRQSSERSDFMPPRLNRGGPVSQEYVSQHQSRCSYSPVRHCPHDPHDPHANYTELNHHTELSSELKHEPMVTQKFDSLDHGLGRSQPAIQKQEISLTSGSHHMGLYHRHLQDPCDDYIGRATERTTVLRQRKVPHSGTTEPSHSRLIEGGSSPYQHNRLTYRAHCVSQDDNPSVTLPPSPDHLLSGRQSRYWVDDQYADTVGDDMYKKVPYPNPDYSNADGTTCYSRSVREGKVSAEPLNHSRLGDLSHLPRSLHRPWVQKDGYESDTHGAILHRERKGNSIFSNGGKGLCKAYYSPSRDTNVDPMEYEPSDLPVRGNRYHVHPGYNCDEMSDDVHTDYDTHSIDPSSVNSDAEDEDYEDGYNQRRTTVHDRLSLPSPPITGYNSYFFKRRLGMPCVMHSHYAPNTMVDTATVLMNSGKKRQYLYPSDFARKNSQANKLQKNGCEDYFKSNARYSNHGSAKGSDEDATDGGSPVNDPQEGSEEFNRQVERAFLTYLREINDSAWEKKKFLQPWKGSIHCYVCGRQSSKEFAETHDLVMHTFNTQKPGLKASHRGLHKALCLSFGWNWSVAPDLSKRYKVGPSDEAEKLKRELILWPPIVVIRNISVESKASKVVSLGDIECMFKEIIGEGKAKLSFGKPSDQSIILVKLQPLYSGFVLAEKLHNKFAQSNHGKVHLEFILKLRSDTKMDNETNEIENEDVLYGYMAGIEDFDKLDPVTKKMYKGQKDILRSRKEIVATAARHNEHAA